MSYRQSTTAIIHGLMGISPQSYLFPFYDEQWLTYDPKDNTVCSLKSWADLWQHAEVVTLIADLIIIVIILFLFTFLENLLRFIRTERNCTENTRFTFEAFINESADDKVEIVFKKSMRNLKGPSRFELCHFQLPSPSHLQPNYLHNTQTQ
jgi:hypothetical protein